MSRDLVNRLAHANAADIARRDVAAGNGIDPFRGTSYLATEIRAVVDTLHKPSAELVAANVARDLAAMKSATSQIGLLSAQLRSLQTSMSQVIAWHERKATENLQEPGS